MNAAAAAAGRPLTVLPGIEITSQEGVHVLGLFPASYSSESRTAFLGWLEIPGSGDTRIASRRSLAEIFGKLEEQGGLTIIPHPFSQGMGLLDSARKISTREEWLESGHVRLIQISDWDKIKYIARDSTGNWVNRFVLASASPEQICSSRYCLAPFNRTDAHQPSDIENGCSWFRMAEASIDGLKQVACEPKARIALSQPNPARNNAILGVKVFGGYSDGQFFKFSDAMNCIIGQNYAGKSAVFDFLRFVLGAENEVDDTLRNNLMSRLYGILTPGGSVEAYVRQEQEFYALKRKFDPVSQPGSDTLRCDEPFLAYRYDRLQDSLIRVDDFRFPVEVYEQHRISRLRDDVARQLDMLDEFAGVAALKTRRADIIDSLNKSAAALAPLYEECDRLRSDVGNLSQFEQELADKEKLIPGDEEQAWANSATVVQRLKDTVEDLVQISQLVPDPTIPRLTRSTQLEQLFTQTVPSITEEPQIHPEVGAELSRALRTAIDSIEAARIAIVAAVETLRQSTLSLETGWGEKKRDHDDSVRAKLRIAGVESPQEIIDCVQFLRAQIDNIKTKRQPRLSEICGSIDQHEGTRVELLANLETTLSEIGAIRQEKATELTESVSGQVRISITRNGDTALYAQVLDELCSEIASRDSRIQNREGQLSRVVSQVTPIQLARTLAAKGGIMKSDGTQTNLQDLCGITEHTENFLCRIADDIIRLNKLQTVETPDVPEIQVQRTGEATFADLRTGLSPGEQSAAILTLALQTRSMPLILDQPEDELGYSYVVHLIVPKILQAKFSRQLLVVTHNANIPVLGDADYVLKMENQPRAPTGRACVVAESGCFELPAITNALVELEGGHRAFEFRQHRYAVPAGKH